MAALSEAEVLKTRTPPGVRRKGGGDTSHEDVERLLSATESLLLAGKTQREIRKALSVLESRRLFDRDDGVEVSLKAVKRYTSKVKGRWKDSDERAEGDVRARLIAAAEEVERQAIEDHANARQRKDGPGAAAFANLRLRAIAQQAKLRGIDRTSRPLLAPEDPISGPLPPRDAEPLPTWEPDRDIAKDVASILQRAGRIPAEVSTDDAATALLAPSGSDPAPPALPAGESGHGPVDADGSAGGVPRTP